MTRKPLARIAALAITASLTLAAHGGDLSNLGALTQAEFRTVAEDLGAAVSYKAVAPTAGLGVTGFDVGVEVSGVDISRSAGALSKAGASSSPSNNLMLTRVHAHKGLPFGLDVGAYVGGISAINTNVFGAELRYAVLDGGVATPALGLRAAYSNMTGSNQLAISTRSIDLSISKGFAVFTPYAGVGQVWVDATPSAGALSSENPMMGKVFVGASVSLGLLNLTFETDRTGSASSWSAKASLHW